MVGKGSLNHNSREFYAPNVDPSRSHLNMEFCKEDIRTVYHELFDAAQQRYNARQTRSDRRIADYYEKSRPLGRRSPFTRLCCKSETRTIPASARKWRNLPGNVWKRMSMAFKHETTHCVCFLLICTWMKRRLMSILILCPISPAANGEWIPVYPQTGAGADGLCGRNAQRHRVESVGAAGKAGAGGYHAGAWYRMGATRHPRRTPVCIGVQKQERSKEVKELDSAIAQKRTEVEKIEDTLQAVQKQVVDLDKIEAVSAKKALLSDRVTLPRSDFENLLHAAKQYVVYRRQDEQLQKLRDAAQEKIRQLESVLNSLKKKVNDLTNRLGEQTARYRQALMEERARRMQVEKENARLKREKAGMVSLLRKHKIEWKENLFTERNER